MGTIVIPLPFPQLEAKPPLSAQIRISDDMQQVLSLLSGYTGQQRKLIRVSSSGVLYATSPLLKDIINLSAVLGNWDWTGTDIPCSDVIVKAHPDNAGLVWVNKDDGAEADVGWPLSAGESFGFTLENLINLKIRIVNDAEKAIIAYSI